MQAPEKPDDEACRLASLHSLRILDTPGEERFDRITRLARRLLDVPIALVSLVDQERQWFKSRQGLDATETSREISFCGHAILGDQLFCIPNALEDERFADNPLVTGEPHIRFYAGQPLRAADGARLGTLCVIDREPRALDEGQRECLVDLAEIVEDELRTLSFATQDALTGLANRSTFDLFAEARLEKAAGGDVPLSLLVFDLDHFKELNDGMGHLAGDAALRQIGHALRSAFRQSDLVARVGGDEFCVIFEGDLALAQPPLDRLARLVEVVNEARPQEFPLTYSVGGACYDPERHESFAELYADADHEMYADKRAHRKQRRP